jgi:hypothetical protein
MELEEVKAIWRQYDEKLDRQTQLNMHLLKEIELDKTRSALRRLMASPILLIVLGAFMQVALGLFIVAHTGQVRFWAPALLLDLFAVFIVVSSALQLSIIAKIDYGAPVTKIQENVERLRIRRIYFTTVHKLSGPLLWLPVLIVGLKAWWGFDFYAYFDHAWIASNLALGLAFIVLAVWLARHYVDGKIRWPWLKNLMEDITGRNLSKARAALKSIDDFSREPA